MPDGRALRRKNTCVGPVFLTTVPEGTADDLMLEQ